MDIQKKFEINITEPVEIKNSPIETEQAESRYSVVNEPEEVNQEYSIVNKPEEVSPEYSIVNEIDGGLDLAKFGQKIAEEMEEQNYHPVVIFGSSNSGKSSLLGSLLGYFQIDSSKGIGIYLGDPIIPTTTPHGNWMFREAESFFYKSVQEFLDGNAHAATKTPHPFFIPIRLTPPNLPEIKLAFMESNGEWYQPKKDTGKYFPELKEEINAILKHYKKGISFIHLAPFTQINAWDDNRDNTDLNKQEIKDASLALVGSFNSYEQLRVFKDDDEHMFLITKWDASAKNNIYEHLQFVELAEVEAVARNLYERGFTAFNNLSINSDHKKIMHYCSGVMSGRSIIKASSELKPILNRYPQTMWNWLYGNAANCNLESLNKRLELMPKPRPQKKSIINHLNDFINKILN